MENSVKPAYQKWKALKNFVVLITAIFLIVSANQPTTQLQSSLNIKGGIGTTSTGIGQGASIVAFLLLPTIFSDLLGLKYTMVLGFLIESLSILANFYPAWYTLAPAAIFSYSFTGLGRVCQGAYTTILAERYTENTGGNKNQIISFMFGIYNTVSSFGYVVGNLISYNVLKQAELTVNTTRTNRSTCGRFFIDDEHQDKDNFKRPPQLYIYILFGCLTIVGILSVVTLIFLDSMPKSKCKKNYRQMLFETLTFNKDWRAALLWPSNFNRGLVVVYVVADITKAFSTCLIGMQSVGLFCMAYGASMTVFCFGFGFLAKYFGRVPVFTISVILEMALLIFSLVWTPAMSHDSVTVYLMAILGGSVIAGLTINFHGMESIKIALIFLFIWVLNISFVYDRFGTILQVFHGAEFPDTKESSMANYMLAENAGSMVGNAYSSSLTMVLKAGILFGVLFISCVSYAAIEISLALRKRRSSKDELAMEQVR